MFSGVFVFLAFGEPPTSVEGTRDYSTDFFPPRYVKFHVIRIAIFYVAVFLVANLINFYSWSYLFLNMYFCTFCNFDRL
ncbi:hypothetical protein EAP48_16305 [Salmonella enterica]|nr:hypothetical protein [Salmonella enterica]EAU4643021.1 hypothetical protein [Salmonella enterica]